MLYVFLCTHSYSRTDAEQQFTHTIPKSDKNFIQTTVEKIVPTTNIFQHTYSEF